MNYYTKVMCLGEFSFPAIITSESLSVKTETDKLQVEANLNIIEKLCICQLM
jgi:hypothetical protein